MQNINFLSSATVYRTLFLEPLCNRDDKALSETSQKISVKRRDLFPHGLDPLIEIGLYEGAILGYFDDQNACKELENWAKQPPNESIQKIAKQICQSIKPSKAPITSKQAANYHWLLSKAYFDKAEYDKALTNALAAIKANPSDKTNKETAFDLFFQLGEDKWDDDPQTEYQINNVKEAVKFYRMAHAIDLNKFGIHIPRILKHCLKNKEIDEAIIFFKFVIISSTGTRDEKEASLITQDEWLQLCEYLQVPREKTLPQELLLDKILSKREPPVTDTMLAILCGKRYLKMQPDKKL